jgi:hypothetical protein
MAGQHINLNEIMSLQRLGDNERDRQLQREQRQQIFEAGEEQKWQYQQAQEQSKQEALRSTNWARAQEVYKYQREEAERQRQLLLAASEKKYQDDIAQAKAAGSTRLAGFSVPDSQKKIDRLHLFENILSTSGKDWTPETVVDQLSAIQKADPQSPLNDPTAWAYATDFVKARAAGQPTAPITDKYRTNLLNMTNLGQGEAQAKIAGMQRTPPDPAQMKKWDDILAEDPNAALQRILASQPGGSPEATGLVQQSPLSQLGAMVRGDTEKTLGNKLPDILAPFTAGAITDSAGGKFAIPTAGHGQDEISKGFNYFNEDPAAALAAQGPTRVTAPTPPPITPVEHVNKTLEPVPAAVPPGTENPMFSPAPPPSTQPSIMNPLGNPGALPGAGDWKLGSPGPTGMQDLHHVVAAHASVNGPHTERIRQMAATKSPEEVMDVLHSHSLATGIPLEHLAHAAKQAGILNA